tara:strand:+ start:634 stop:2769 length:2136 start_codon:yes stop_codon:yes gene_type:complete
MPLKKLDFKPGVNRERTRYSNEGGWYECNNVRFRQGLPEKIGGWTRTNTAKFDGVARSLFNWITLGGQNLLGVGTNLKFLIENGGNYNNITPIRSTTSAGEVTFSALQTTLAADVTSTTTGTVGPLASISGIPDSGLVKINNEVISYTGLKDGSLTGCTRGASSIVEDVATSTTATTHSSGDTVSFFTLLVTDTDHGATDNDFVTFSGAVTLGGAITADVLNQEYQVQSVKTSSTYTIIAKSLSNTTNKFSDIVSTSSDSGNGGGSVVGTYQINSGSTSATPLEGWGASGFGAGAWNQGEASFDELRVWSQSNFGEDLIFGNRNGPLYYFDTSEGITTTRGVLLSSRAGASQVPSVQNVMLVSDINRFVFCFGTNPIGSSTKDPMLIRWSDQESAVEWNPSATNQAGSLRLSRGTEIVSAMQARQEVLVWTDSSLYSLQYVGINSGVWGAQIVGETISIASKNTVAMGNGIAYWMGKDKFYMYDGRVKTLPCDIRRYIFNDFNVDQLTQVFGGTNEAFNEIWWFYCSASSSDIDRYVIYNYSENIWYYGNMARSAWLDSGLRDFPLAATYNNVLVDHERGIDDNETGTAAAISSFISSADFDLDDGDKFVFVRRMVPDVSFEGSTDSSPAVTLTLSPSSFPGSGLNSPLSESGESAGTVTRTATSPVEVYTTQIHTRLRGRQMALKIESSATGVQWQLGIPRVDMRPDGRR